MEIWVWRLMLKKDQKHRQLSREKQEKTNLIPRERWSHKSPDKPKAGKHEGNEKEGGIFSLRLWQ